MNHNGYNFIDVMQAHKFYFCDVLSRFGLTLDYPGFFQCEEYFFDVF